MAEIFDEVNEEIKQEKLEKFWQENGLFLIVSVICVVLAVGAKSWWVNHVAEKQASQTEALLQVLDQEDPSQLVTLADSASGDHKILAQFLAAGLTQENAKTADEAKIAIDHYRQIAAHKRTPDYYKDLALILAIGLEAEYGFVQTDDVLKNLAPLAEQGRVYRASALELMANIEGDRKNYAAAIQYAEDILDIKSGISLSVTERAALLKEFYLLQMSEQNQ